ncbi:alkaline phosphatase [Shewanella indica]|uniref:alkaline phosphatase n=1 Tax=Shewanella TaxID=22 RepID=UPI00138F6FEC|nr:MULTISPECIES: alkaline phosphatase [Shewanella]MCE9791820.1 alkaline phosphatase [Shewanella indica]NDO73497.1 alkaline phosphatase [Shewanella sp. SE1]BCV35313.1 alkaline phosphatase [Shewanella chilikensis]
MKLSQLTGALLGLSLLLPLAVDANQLPNPAPSRPQNIVIMVGDGMGPAYTSAYRYFKDNPDTEEIEQTVFDRLLVGMASTYPARVSGYVTDSAAAATALATGVKSYNGAISVDTQKQPIPTIMEKAKQRGMSTGVAVTSQINHATPAAFLSHSESRKHYVELANKYLETDADVMLGGGQKYFDQELLAKFDAKGYQILQEFSALESITQPKVMGLFAEVQLPWVLDDKDGHRLSTMTGKALELLSQNNNGFVLLVEGSLIDWAGHNNDIAAAMAEMDEFARTMEVVEQFVRQNPNTLMVATADHNTGGLSIGSKGKYAWNPEVLKGLSASIDTLAAAALTAEDWQAPLAQGLGFELEPALLEQLAKARMQGKETLASAIKQEVDRRSNTGWTTGGHTGTDVQVFAAGPGAELFIGNQDNTDIASKLSSLLPKGQHATK